MEIESIHVSSPGILVSFTCETGERGVERGIFLMREWCYETDREGREVVCVREKGAERGDAGEKKGRGTSIRSQWGHREVTGDGESAY